MSWYAENQPFHQPNNNLFSWTLRNNAFVHLNVDWLDEEKNSAEPTSGLNFHRKIFIMKLQILFGNLDFFRINMFSSYKQLSLI